MVRKPSEHVKLSDVIAKLEAMKSEHGNLPVGILFDTWGLFIEEFPMDDIQVRDDGGGSYVCLLEYRE